MTPRLRAGGATDIDAIMAVMAAAFDPGFGEAWSAAQMLGSIDSEASWIRIAEAEGAPDAIGFSLCRRAGPEAELLLIGVTPAARRSGVGAAMLAAAKRDARLRGAETIFLEVRDGNVGAMGLYRAAGFAVIGRRRDYYRGPGDLRYDAITLRSDLDK